MAARLPFTMPGFSTPTPQVEFGPEAIIVNALVRTMDPAQPEAEGLAILGGRILALGSTAMIRRLACSGTRVIDAAGQLVLPGFIDAHVHFLMGGFSLQDIELRDASSPDEVVERLARFAAGVPKGAWILGGNWDHESWPGAPLPTRAMIDPVTPQHPVLVRRLDAHMSLANSLALRFAGINASTEDPPGGVIVRGEDGQPTGLLKDAAEQLVARVVPAKTPAQKEAAALAATAHAASLGVTSVTDMSADEDIPLYQRLADESKLLTRIYGARTIVSWGALSCVGVRRRFGGDMVRIGAVKGFADGSLGSSTALFFEPYVGRPENRGLLFEQMLPEGVMLERVSGADAAGLQVMIHAIGDQANARILDIYDEVGQKNGHRDRRFRIEHAQHLRPADIPRFKKSNVIASMQPYHVADDGRWCEKRIGPERCKGAYAFRSLLRAGVVLAFGSDWTVAPLNPLLGIKAAVTRQTLDGRHPDGWYPAERISVEEAVRAYTAGSAYAEFADEFKGSLAPGKFADLVLLDRDILTVPPDQIDHARVTLTMIGGRVVFAA
jgi:predicted amidohydrolase YtcJ